MHHVQYNVALDKINVVLAIMYDDEVLIQHTMSHEEVLCMLLDSGF